MKVFLGVLVLLATGLVIHGFSTVHVTCSPVLEQGSIKCLCNHVMPNQPSYMALSLDAPMKCQITLRAPVNLANNCCVLWYEPKFTQCSATLPRGMLAMAHYELVGPDVIRPPETYIISQEHIACQKLKECGYLDRDHGCVVDEDCRLCLEDFRAFFPGEKAEVAFCAKPSYD